MNKKDKLLRAKYCAFTNHFRKICDPQGLVYVMSTGRMWASQEAEIIEAIGEKYGKYSRMRLMDLIVHYGKCTFTTPDIDSKPRLNKKLKDVAEKYANMIVESSPLFKVN